MTIPFSVLDLCPVPAGATPADALRNTLALARHAEALGFRRYWLAEHHNMPGIASAATAVVIGYVAQGHDDHPRRLRRRDAAEPRAARHRRAVRDARVALSRPHRPGARARAGHRPADDPGAAARRPRRGRPLPAGRAGAAGVLRPRRARAARARGARARASTCRSGCSGSSLFSAQLAALLGLPFAFASHFAPDELCRALEVYRGPVHAVAAARAAVRDGSPPTSSRPTPTPRRAGSSRRCSSRSSTSAGARPARSRRRSTTSTPSGLRSSGTGSSTRSRTRSSGTRPRSSAACAASGRRRRRTRSSSTAHLAEQPARLRSLELVAEIARGLG